MTQLARGLLVAVALVLLGARWAGAHELSMAEMEVHEVARGEYLWQWTATGARPASSELRPRWPDGCRAEAASLRCADGLKGVLAIDGVGQRYSAALVKVRWLDGQVRTYTLTGGQPTVRLHGSADDTRGVAEVVSAYAVLGVEHILSGIDHLLFVLSLLFLVGFNRRLVWTITAFTAAHSLTLGLAATGLLVLRPPPVEAAIALSIMLVAGEALHDRPTWSRRWPAFVAFLFGLVHGLGFAGALKEVGLPEHQIAAALVAFNLGVEAGQLLVVGGAWLLWRAASRWPQAGGARAPALYAIGGIAAYWTIGRVTALLA